MTLITNTQQFYIKALVRKLTRKLCSSTTAHFPIPRWSVSDKRMEESALIVQDTHCPLHIENYLLNKIHLFRYTGPQYNCTLHYLWHIKRASKCASPRNAQVHAMLMALESFSDSIICQLVGLSTSLKSSKVFLCSLACFGDGFKLKMVCIGPLL